MIVVGIDPSLTGTGVVALHPMSAEAYSIASRRFGERSTGRSLYARASRIEMLVDRVAEFVDAAGDVAAIGIESPSYGSRAVGGLVYERAALFIALAIRLKSTARMFEIAPTQRAKYATGKGNADKMSVVTSTLAEHALQTRDDNEIDAFVLAKIVARALDAPIDQTTEYRTEIVQRVIAAHN